MLTLTVDANGARERGQATGAARTPERSLVTDYTWTPKYISTSGVPQDPTGSTVDRLASLQRQAIACADLKQSRP